MADGLQSHDSFVKFPGLISINVAMAAAIVNSVATSFITPAPVAPPGQPDIAYPPDYAKYQARAARRVATERLPTTVPEGFPEQLQGDLVWEGDTVAETYDWTYVLSEEQLAEIDEAVKHFKCRLPHGTLGQISIPRSSRGHLLTIPQPSTCPLRISPKTLSPSPSSTRSSGAFLVSCTLVMASSLSEESVSTSTPGRRTSSYTLGYPRT